jgi:cell division initiation protein
MALTPEDVVNKRFQQTKFREGYDQDEVDDFLDEIVVELRRVYAENEELRQKLESAGSNSAGEAPVEKVATPVVAPAPAAPSPADDLAATSSANDLLTLARRLHEEHVREGVDKRDALIAEGHETATRLVAEAEATVKKQLSDLEKEKGLLQVKINELSGFENEYREKLRGYIAGQLSELDELGAIAPAN